MIRHILLLQPRSGTTPQAIEACQQAITSLVGRIPGLVNCHWGENFVAAERREGFTHGFTMDFADRASLDAYGPHPEHKPASALVRATFERIVVLDFDLD
jgi:Stress responsive A/B Barrel Domain